MAQKKHRKSDIQPQKKPSVTNQVRIVGGQFKRSNISFIDAEGLRPTPDRMRETLFNWLMHEVNGARVLDACAGSGVLGFEALSRGAESVSFIETNASQYQQLIKSAEQLKLTSEQAYIYHGKAEAIISELSSAPFHLIFLDPPYALDLWQVLLNALSENQLLTADTLIYIEADKPLTDIFDSLTIDSLHILKEKKMGQVNTWLVTVTS